MCYVISCSRDVSKYIRISTTRLSVYSIQRKRKVLSCSSSARIHTQLTLCAPLEWLTRNRNQTLPLTVKNWNKNATRTSTKQWVYYGRQTTLCSCGRFYYQNRYLSIDRLWIIKEEQMNTTAATIYS